jgi:glycosyltransferase involved in cell wall biosynthesis
MQADSPKVRIALAIEHPLHQSGGIETLARSLIKALARQYEIVLVSGDRDRESLGADYAPHVVEHLSWTLGTRDRANAKALAEALHRSGARLVHFHGSQYDWQTDRAWFSPIHYTAALGLPALYSNHLVLPLLAGYCKPERPLWQKIALLPRAWLSRASIMRRLRAEVLVSRHDRDLMRRNFPPFSGKLRLIYHSQLSLEDVEVVTVSRRKVIVSLGTFCRRKGQAVLARAFLSIASAHPDWSLEMVGRVDEENYLAEVKAVAAQAPDRIRILPPTDAPLALLRQASIFAMPSLIEPLGLALQEALFAGCACVGSAVGGIPELMEDGSGILIPPGDEPSLAKALDQLMSDADLRTRLGQNASKSILSKGMLAENMVQAYRDIYEAILSGKNEMPVAASEPVRNPA